MSDHITESVEQENGALRDLINKTSAKLHETKAMLTAVAEELKNEKKKNAALELKVCAVLCDIKFAREELEKGLAHLTMKEEP